VIVNICSFPNYWVGVYSEEEAVKINMEAKDKATNMVKVFRARDYGVQAQAQAPATVPIQAS
jgi:hypothetical protein